MAARLHHITALKLLGIIVLTWLWVARLNGVKAQPYAIGQTTITFNDPTRTGGFGSGGGPGRQIQTEIYYPAQSAGVNAPMADGNFPLIVFGHGFAMVWSAYANIWEAFVPQGYIAAFPRTESNIFPAPSHNNFALDLALVAERIQALNTNANSLFYNKVAPYTALIGHSMGGGASVLAAKNSPVATTLVGLAPAETTPSAIAAAADVQIPTLILSGAADGVTPPSVHHLPIFNAVSASCKLFINIKGGAHCYFANPNFNCDLGESTSSTNISITRTAQQQIMNQYLGYWLSYYLKNEQSAWSVLDSAATDDNRITVIKQCAVTATKNKTTSCTKLWYKHQSHTLAYELHLNNQTLNIYAIDGRTVLSTKLATQSGELKLPHLRAGVYMATIAGQSPIRIIIH